MGPVVERPGPQLRTVQGQAPQAAAVPQTVDEGAADGAADARVEVAEADMAEAVASAEREADDCRVGARYTGTVHEGQYILLEMGSTDVPKLVQARNNE